MADQPGRGRSPTGRPTLLRSPLGKGHGGRWVRDRRQSQLEQLSRATDVPDTEAWFSSWSHFNRRVGFGGLVASPSHIPVTDTGHSLGAGGPHTYSTFTGSSHRASPWLSPSLKLSTAPAPPNPCTRPLSMVSVTSGQLQSEIIKWKIPETKNSYVLNCVLF